MTNTQYTQTTDSNGTSNLNHLLSERLLQVIMLMQPRDLEKIFGPGEDVDIPEKGYTDPEWYFRASDGTVWGIGWRWGRTRLRGRPPISRGNFFYSEQQLHASAEQFVQFINRELIGA